MVGTEGGTWNNGFLSIIVKIFPYFNTQCVYNSIQLLNSVHRQIRICSEKNVKQYIDTQYSVIQGTAKGTRDIYSERRGKEVDLKAVFKYLKECWVEANQTCLCDSKGLSQEQPVCFIYRKVAKKVTSVSSHCKKYFFLFSLFSFYCTYMRNESQLNLLW